MVENFVREIFKVLNIEKCIGLRCMVFNKKYIGLHGLIACPRWIVFFDKGIFGEESVVMSWGGN
jgi:hypothetical protein